MIIKKNTENTQRKLVKIINLMGQEVGVVKMRFCYNSMIMFI